MATVREIFNFIDEIAPFSSAEEWDNPGLLVGDENRIVNKILFALDITGDVIEQAVSSHADLIITHHPVIFKPIFNVTADSLVYKLIRNNISIICAHTNYDKAQDGVNDILCRAVGLDSFERCDGMCLNIGELKNMLLLQDFICNIKSILGGTVRYNNGTYFVKKIAVCSGAGSDYLKTAAVMGCDVLLTGDGSHHNFLDAQEYGLALVCAGHFETETIAVEPLMKKIQKEFGVDCVVAEQKTPIITV